jgi:hypothetical protein
LSSSSTSTAKQQQHQSSTEFDDLLQHSIRSAQNISSEFSYSIELDSPENRKDGSIEDSDTASSSVCSENALQSKVEQFMMFIGCGGEYQQEKKVAFLTTVFYYWLDLIEH